MTDNLESTQVILWSKPSCQQCNATERSFTEKGIEFVKLDISAPENQAQLTHFKDNYGFAQAPIVELGGITVDDQGGRSDAWSGFRPDLIEQLVARIAGD